MPDRTPMSPAEFDTAIRRFAQRFAGRVHQTSGTRSIRGNITARGHTMSKHLYGMAADFDLNAPDVDILERNTMVRFAKRLGFWTKNYSWGIHLQGLPTGPIPHWWWLKYGEGKTADKVGVDHLPELVRSNAV